MKNINKSNTNQFIKWGVTAALTVSVMSSAYAHGDAEKVITQAIDVSSAQTLFLDAHVGTVKFTPSKDDKIHVYVKVSEKDDWGLFKRSVQEAQLMIKQEGLNVTITLNDDEFGEEWEVAMPQMAALNVELGVGEMQIRHIDSDLTLDVGVGATIVVGSASDYSSAKGQAGVGAAVVRSDSGTQKTDRSFVSEDVIWTGSGEYAIDVEVGVGDISIKLD